MNFITSYRKWIYQKRKAKFDKIMKKRGISYKTEFAPPLTFGIGSLSVFIPVLAMAVFFFPIYGAVVFNLDVGNLAWLTICTLLFTILTLITMKISAKYYDTQMFAQTANDLAIGSFIFAPLVLLLVFLFHYIGFTL